MAVLPGSSGLDSADNWNARQIFYTEDKALVPIETDPEIRLENQRRITFSWGKVLGQLFIMRQNNGDGEGDGKYHKNGKSHDLYRCNRYRRDCGVGISHYADCHALSR